MTTNWSDLKECEGCGLKHDVEEGDYCVECEQKIKAYEQAEYNRECQADAEYEEYMISRREG
jgi:hypothetical protein